MGEREKDTQIKEKNLTPAKRNVLLLGLFLFALCLKLFIFFTVSSPVIFFKYPFFADKINKGLDIGERIFDLSPLYLYGMVGLQKLYGPNWEAMVVFQILTGCLTVVFLFLIGERLFGRLVGVTAAVLLALYGNLTLFEMTLEPDALLLFFNALFLLTLWKAEGQPSSRRKSLFWILAGVILGLSIITKPNALLFIPAVLVWTFWIVSGKKEKVRTALLLLAGLSLMVLPITLRNYLVYHDPVLVTADFGKVFFHGNGPGATGLERADLPEQGFMEESGEEPDYAHVLFRKTARAMTQRQLKPSECSRFWLEHTWDHLKTHPAEALTLGVKKALLLGLNYEVHDLDNNYALYQTIRSWPLIPFGLLAAFGLLGMVLSRKHLKQTFWPLSMVGVYWLTGIIFFPASRYRLPSAPFLALFAAYSFWVIIERLKVKDYKQGLLLAGIGLSLFLGSQLLFKQEVDALDRWQQATRVHYNLRGNTFFKNGQYQKAMEEYQKAIALAPGFAPAYNQMGKCSALLNDLSSAEKYFQKVIQLTPTVDQGYRHLGFLYELKGEFPQAIVYLKKAHSLNGSDQKVLQLLKRLQTDHP
jgi:4-amino-4-deoxy-L-arabinose transferase-like glycosyltransferase